MPNRTPRLASYPIVSGAALLAVAASGLGLAARAQSKPAGLPAAIRAEMNTASAKFVNAQADLRQELYTKVIHDTETQNGQIYFLHHNGTEMGMKLFAPDAAAGSAPVKVVQFQGDVLRVFSPGTNQVDQFSATGKNQTTAETMMTLGFGGSGTDLEKEWTVTDQGSEKMDEDGKAVEVTKLDLVSKDPAIRKTYSHITIWLDPVRDVSLKQVSFDASSGDTRTVTYSNIRLNQAFNSGSFQIKCKGKCTVVNH